MSETKEMPFAKRKVLYLRHVVSQSGISADKSKVDAVEKCPIPTKVRSFVGLVSYYKRFIPGFSKIAGSLFALTKKDSVSEWSPSCQQAFEKLKQFLVASPILVFPDFTKRLGLGAVLSQKQSSGQTASIAYAS